VSAETKSKFLCSCSGSLVLLPHFLALVPALLAPGSSCCPFLLCAPTAEKFITLLHIVRVFVFRTKRRAHRAQREKLSKSVENGQWVVPWMLLYLSGAMCFVGGAYACPMDREIMSNVCSRSSTGRIRNAARGCQSITPPVQAIDVQLSINLAKLLIF